MNKSIIETIRFAIFITYFAVWGVWVVDKLFYIAHLNKEIKKLGKEILKNEEEFKKLTKKIEGIND